MEVKLKRRNRIDQIKYYPIDFMGVTKLSIDNKPHSCHESLLRYFHITEFIKDYLKAHTKINDTSLLLEIIEYLEK